MELIGTYGWPKRNRIGVLVVLIYPYRNVLSLRTITYATSAKVRIHEDTLFLINSGAVVFPSFFRCKFHLQNNTIVKTHVVYTFSYYKIFHNLLVEYSNVRHGNNA